MRPLALLLILFVSGCMKSEQKCADEIREELSVWTDAGTNPPENSGLTRSEWLDLAETAATSALRITNIQYDENWDACDYTTYGPNLVEK